MIDVENICKTFKLYKAPVDRLREIVFKKKIHREYVALDHVSFTVSKGETLGIIGENGAGKSTLLKILTGVYLQDSGSVSVNGKITGLLELGTGFNQEFSGMENIYLNGTFLGMTRREIDRKLTAIIDFTELGSFIEEPVKTYSSGMVMRLAFSIAIHADPDAFVVDEALGVGDAYFQQKCMTRLKEFKRGHGAMIFVSHDASAVKLLCDRAILLNRGVVVEHGDPESVLNCYNYMLAKKRGGEEIVFKKKDTSYGNRKVEITAVFILDEAGGESELITTGRPVTVVVQFLAREPVEELTLGIAIRDRFGQDIFGTNTFHLKKTIQPVKDKPSAVSFCFDAFNIGPGKYTLTVAAHSGDTHVDNCYHWIDSAKSFEIVADSSYIYTGILRLKPEIKTHEPA